MSNKQVEIDPDPEQARFFLSSLDDDAEQFTFQAIPDTDQGQPEIIHSPFSDCSGKLEELNQNGSGIYVTINRTDGEGLQEKNITRIRSVFADLGDRPLELVERINLQAHLKLEVAPDQHYILWRVEDLAKRRFQAVQKRLAQELNSDARTSLSSVVRLPGFYNCDPAIEDDPYEVKVCEEQTLDRYGATEVTDAIPCTDLSCSEQEFSLPFSITQGEGHLSDDRKSELSDYAAWLRRHGKGREEIIDELDQANEERCIPPLDQEQIENIVDSISSFPPGPDEDEFSPDQFGHTILKEEAELGIHYAYVANQGLYYRYKDEDGVWSQVDEEYIKQMIRKRGVTSRRDVNEVLGQIKFAILDEENEERFDPGRKPDPDHINFQNGILRWETGELKDHDPMRYDLVQIPYEYDPDASCELWEETLEEWVPDKDTRRFLQEFIGYSLIPDTSFDRMLFLLGGGKNGKSTFLKVIEALLGKENFKSIPLSKLTNQSRFETAYLQGALVNCCTDIDPGKITSTRLIKKITSGEPVRGEVKHGGSFDFTPFARMIFSANELPKTSDTTTGWYRRFEIVEFPNQFDPDDEDTDRYLDEKLKTEIPGIINWAVDGLRRLMDRGSMEPSEEMERKKLQYKRENDSVRAWYKECIEPGDQSDKFPTQRLYEHYCQWCDEVGIDAVRRQTLSKRLKRFGEPQKGSYTFEVCTDCEKFSCDSNHCKSSETEMKRRRGFSGIQIKEVTNESHES